VSATSFACSPDGTQIAYDRCGAGQAILLLHGGGGTRREWHETGYVQRLQSRYSVVTMDVRGHGESDRPADAAAYSTDKMSQDILAVADACGIERFAMWAMSYGGKVGRYLATHSERVTSLVLMGTPLGPGVVGERRQQAVDFLAHWQPIVHDQQDGTFDPHTLTDADRDVLSRLHVPSMLGWVRAMLDWPSVEPQDLRCPTLWLVGSEDRHATDSLREYEGTLEGTQVRVHLLPGLDHDQVFDEIDQVYPIMLAFTESGCK
jgi:pimeloyl-ACP methyl ester carboxylesterase